MKKIGIMGGTFNPVHNVHLLLAEHAYCQFQLDEIMFMPSRRPPHKSLQEIADDEHRLNMLLLATKNNTHFSVSTEELNRDGITYTADTLISLHKSMPDTEFYFIIGGDSLRDIEHWYHPEIIFANAHVLASGRYELSAEEVANKIKHLNNLFHTDIQLIDIPNLQISSQMLRSMHAAGESLRYLVPDEVNDYINNNQLYLD